MKPGNFVVCFQIGLLEQSDRVDIVTSWSLPVVEMMDAREERQISRFLHFACLWMRRPLARFLNSVCVRAPLGELRSLDD